MTYVVDIHGLAWFLKGSSRLSIAAQAALTDAAAQVVVPTLVLVEITFLRKRNYAEVEILR